MEDIRIRRVAHRDVKFSGNIIAFESSRNMLRSDTRWSEYTVYKTESGKIVFFEQSITLWQGEEDKDWVHTFESIEDFKEWVIDECAGEGEEPNKFLLNLLETSGIDMAVTIE